MCKENLNEIDEELECECSCEECTCEDGIEGKLYTEDEIVDIVEQCVSEIIPKVVVDFEPVQGIDVFDDGFIDGTSSASFLAGFYSTLVSAGMSPKDAYELTMNQSTIMGNIEQQKIINDGQIQVAKYQSLAGLQTQI